MTLTAGVLSFPGVVLVSSPDAGRSQRLPRARKAFAAAGLQIICEIPVPQLSSLNDVIRRSGSSPPLIVAAGGDGTVGAVADRLAFTELVLGILPLGTSNDFARSLGIPTNIERAVALLTSGKIATVDLGRVTCVGDKSRHFAHAATVGLNVNFAKLATRASLRKRLRRLTYVVAAALAFRHPDHFDCRLTHDGEVETLRLTQLSVINAPVFGGFLGLRVTGVSTDDGLLDVLAVEVLPVYRLFLAALYAVGRIKRPVTGVHPYHVRELSATSDPPLDLAVDGEVFGTLPADFVVAGAALHVITPACRMKAPTSDPQLSRGNGDGSK
jgi:diacylglycerol kinase (ATP)